jgi:branched-chain amino acid transport system substrate-binding protein
LSGRTRALWGAALAAVAVALGGCAQAASTGTAVTGSTLTIYARQTSAETASQDVIDAENLALQQAGGQVGHYKVRFKVLPVGRKISDDARTAVSDTSTIAYLGELAPHSSADSIGITNGQGILQVSPTDTALELTQTTPAVSGAPNRYYENLSSYHRTFARVIPASAKEAGVLVKLMGQEKVTKLYVTADPSLYGKSIAYAVIAAARTAGIAVNGIAPQPATPAKIKISGADAVFDGAGAGGEPAAARLFSAIAATEPKLKLFGPSTLATDTFATLESLAAQRATFVTSPGPLPSRLNKAGKLFMSDFVTAYHRQPTAGAIFGYVAMGAVLQAIRAAGGTSVSRAAVRNAFFKISDFPTALGPLTINTSTGDPQGVWPYVVSRIRGERLVPSLSLQG